ncbi:MAG: sel1 repeat family protein [Parachlamydiaceae bacterium]|nr:MAG: sel1 repeat family protein [Parachlamydiaceae bacterium]
MQVLNLILRLLIKKAGVFLWMIKKRFIFEEAAEAGCSQAMMQLALRYENGYGVEKDDAKSLRFLQKAAALQNDEALAEMALRYKEGNGVERDETKALHYLKKLDCREIIRR